MRQEVEKKAVVAVLVAAVAVLVTDGAATVLVQVHLTHAWIKRQCHKLFEVGFLFTGEAIVSTERSGQFSSVVRIRIHPFVAM